MYSIYNTRQNNYSVFDFADSNAAPLSIYPALEAISPNQKVLIFVHGFNKCFEHTKHAFDMLDTLTNKYLKYHHTFGFHWPSGDDYLGYSDACERARIAAQHLSKLILMLNKHGAKVSLLGHSMGCRVIFEALNNMVGSDALIDDCILMAAAVPNHDLQYVGGLVNQPNMRLFNMFSINDSVLRFGFPFLEGSSAMGISNASNVYMGMFRNLTSIDCSDIVDGHGAYKTNLVFNRLGGLMG